MKTGIKIRTTYSVITPESAEYGDYADYGVINECDSYTFSELVNALRCYIHPSSSDIDYHTWFSTEGDTNMHTGEVTIESIHFHPDNSDRLKKYWVWAAKIAHKKNNMF